MYRALILILLIPLAGCNIFNKQAVRHNHTNKSPYFEKEEATKKQPSCLIVRIDGVECNLCAQLIIDQLSTIKGVGRAEFKLTGADYEQAYVVLTSENKDVTISPDDIREQINRQGFSLILLEGSFKGVLSSIHDLPCFTFENIDLTARLSSRVREPILLLDDWWQTVKKEKTIEIQACVWFDAETNSYWLTPEYTGSFYSINSTI